MKYIIWNCLILKLYKFESPKSKTKYRFWQSSLRFREILINLEICQILIFFYFFYIFIFKASSLFHGCKLYLFIFISAYFFMAVSIIYFWNNKRLLFYSCNEFFIYIYISKFYFISSTFFFICKIYVIF